MGCFRGYNPLILTFDPNFQRDIHGIPITFMKQIRKLLMFFFCLIFRHENTSFKFTFFGAPQVALYQDKGDVC